MIKMPQNWNEVKEISDRAKLPLGAYVCQTKQCRVIDTDYGSQLVILFDIYEGEYKGFYAADYASNTQQDKKWKGSLRVWLPKDDGSEKDELTKRILKGVLSSFENSNLGYNWNWNEKTLENKFVGIVYRNEEWEYDGKTGWAVRPFRAVSVESVRSGSYTLPKDKPLANKTENAFQPMNNSYQQPMNTLPKSDVNGFVQVDDDDELPF